MITRLFVLTAKRAENTARHAKSYLHGLLSETQRKNSESIIDALGDTQSQDLKNFIAASNWNHADINNHVARQASARIGNHRETTLTLDGSGFTKKRQVFRWCRPPT